MAMRTWEKKQAEKLRAKIEELCTDGLITDEGHHKTWYLEQILETIGVDLTDLRARLISQGYDWEPGIAP
jgi:hypothetical protein